MVGINLRVNNVEKYKKKNQQKLKSLDASEKFAFFVPEE